MIRHPRYVLAVPDSERSARYYRDVLGFEISLRHISVVLRNTATDWRVSDK